MSVAPDLLTLVHVTGKQKAGKKPENLRLVNPEWSWLHWVEMDAVEVCEIFVSIQGESSYAGLPCFFVRLSGCNLRCRYCDTPRAYEVGRPCNIASVVDQAISARLPLVEITGGEPLQQRGFPCLAEALRDKSGSRLLVETNGSLDISVVPDGVVTVMDVKCPGSGEGGSFDERNIARLRSEDEVKFVILDRADYEWAREFVRSHSLAQLCHAVHFSPVDGMIEVRPLADWILEDRLPVRLQVQLHKILKMR